LTLREYRVYFTAPAGITQQVIARSVEKGWQLEEICLERESLDTIFARLSKNSK
jgi:ABC-2 type transport system ATP-binding protein